MSSGSAMQIKSRNESRVAVYASSREVTAGWLMLAVISAVGCAVLTLLVAFDRFELDFLAITR
jgi:hypothetical protein